MKINHLHLTSLLFSIAIYADAANKVPLSFEHEGKIYGVESDVAIHPETLKRALIADNNNTFDLRKLQEEQRRAALKNLPLLMRHKGKFGFAAGLATGLGVTALVGTAMACGFLELICSFYR